MTVLPRTQTPELTVETVAHGSLKLSEQQPEHFTLLAFYRGIH